MDKNADGRITEQEVKEVISPRVALKFARLIRLYRDYCRTIIIIILLCLLIYIFFFSFFFFRSAMQIEFTNLIFDDE